MRSHRDDVLPVVAGIPAPVLSCSLPCVESVDPYDLGVFNSDIARKHVAPGERPPYVRRDQDADLRRALRQEQMVLLAGKSESGKSRSAFEAIAQLFPQHQIIVPRETAALRSLFSLDPPLDLGPEPAILWLDDLERFLLKADALDTKLLDSWTENGRRRVVAIATIRTEEYRRIKETAGEIGRTARQVLDRARCFWLGSVPSPGELAEATRLYPGEDFADGIGEHFAAAKELLDRFRTGKPVGVALVRAAVDWQRCGLTERRVTESDLKALYGAYVPAWVKAATTDVAEELEWAAHPIGSSAALLRAHRNGGERSFHAFDYIIDFVETEQKAQPIPITTWKYVLQEASPEEAFAVGVAAYIRAAPVVAKDAWTTAAMSGDVILSPKATANLGVLLLEEGDLAGAQAAFERAIASRDANAAPSAAVNLGVLLAQQGDVAGARAAYERAIASGHPDRAPEAAFNLGYLLAEQGDLAGAKAAFEQAVASGDEEPAQLATSLLAQLDQTADGTSSSAG